MHALFQLQMPPFNSSSSADDKNETVSSVTSRSFESVRYPSNLYAPSPIPSAAANTTSSQIRLSFVNGAVQIATEAAFTLASSFPTAAKTSRKRFSFKIFLNRVRQTEHAYIHVR